MSNPEDIKPEDKVFVHCPTCDDVMLIADINSTQTPPREIYCLKCDRVSGQLHWVVKRYPRKGVNKSRPRHKIKTFRGYSRKFKTSKGEI